MSYISLYRKYRSQTFGDLVGQDHVVKTLQNAISSGRVAHAYLFTGPRGTGKTSSARLLAKALNAENGPTPNPSDDDPICQMIASGTCPDVLEFDAASEAGVDDVREAIVENIQYLPMMCRYRIFIIDEVHDLSSKAFDALLKTIEEPPSHIVFILATTEYNKVPPTIRSRCQKFEFHRASITDLVDRLQYVADHEKMEIEPAAINAIARMADGGFRDGLTLLEQAALTSNGKVTLAHVYDQLGLISDELVDGLLQAVKQSDVPKIIEILGEAGRMGRDPRAVLESVLHRLGDLTRAAYGIEIGGSGDSSQEAALHATATHLGRDFLLQIRSALSEAHREIRDVTLPRLWLESEMIRLSLPVAAPAPVAKAAPKPQEKPVQTPTKPEPTPRAAATNGAAPATEVAKESPAENVKEALEGDPIADAWRQAVKALSVLSKTMAARLADTRVASSEGKRLLIEFDRQLDSEWVTDSQKRVAAVVEAVQERLGDDWTVDFGFAKREATVSETQAVELPLEGQKLADTVREIFGAGKQAYDETT